MQKNAIKKLAGLFWLCFLATFFSGCATSLTENGSKVELVRSLPADEGARFTPVGIITCTKEQNLASVESNRASCENDLRNQAAEKGADIVVIDAYETFPGTATVGVFMIGHSFRRN